MIESRPLGAVGRARQSVRGTVGQRVRGEEEEKKRTRGSRREQ